MTRDRAIQVLREMKNLTYVATDSRCSAIDMAIESLSADKVEVVRCKDCRYAEHGTMMVMEEKDKTPRHYFDWTKCHNYDLHKGVRFVNDDDFCSWGERREE